MWKYSDAVMDHFRNPHHMGELPDANAVGEAGGLQCGDWLKIMLKIEDDRIADARYQTMGCTAAIASGSALTDLTIGKTVDEAARLTNKDIVDYLNGLPDQKLHCSVMGAEALEAALANYRGEASAGPAEDRVVCKCFGVTEGQIRKAIRENHLTTLEEVTNYTKAGGGCGHCWPEIEGILREMTPALREAKREAAVQPKRLTTREKVHLIEEVMERDIRPALKADGGDIEFVDLDGDTVLVSLRGHCVQCPVSGVTLTGFVERKLRDLVSESLSVEEVEA